MCSCGMSGQRAYDECCGARARERRENIESVADKVMNSLFPETFSLTPQELCELLAKAAAEGIRVAPTAGDYTDSGIAAHVLYEFIAGRSNA